jgi:hypothetical protein
MIALIFSFLLKKIICYKALLFSIYDVKRYSELLIDTCNRVLKPFGTIFDQTQSICRLDNYY